MQGFSIQKLKAETSDGRNCTSLEGYTYTRKDGIVVDFPAGCNSDGASTPPPLWPTLPPFGTYWLAAFSHDGMYRGDATVAGLMVSKDFADETFLEMMEWLGVDEAAAHTMYQGVHVFGWKAFRDDREEIGANNYINANADIG